MQFLSVGFSEHDPDTIKGRSKEDNCCNIDDIQEGRQHVTTALTSPADMKHVLPWAVLTSSGREPVHGNIGSSFSTVALGLQGDMAVICHGGYVRFSFCLGKVNPKPPAILESDLAAIFSFEIVILYPSA